MNLAIKMMFAALVCGIMVAGCGSGGGRGQSTPDANQTEDATAKSEEDKLLDEMEKIVDDFISALRAAQSGDVAAITRSTEVMQKFQEIMQKVALAEEDGKFSEAQKERGEKIAQKVTEAMQ